MPIENSSAAPLLIATRNPGKLREYRELLAGLPFLLLSLQEVGLEEDVQETGETFEENARLKAVTYAQESSLPTLADDSGLEVDALGGEPGVRSHRYAGEGKSDADRVDFLLDKLKGVPPERRTARFRCSIVVAGPHGEELGAAEGTCEGRIGAEPRGTNGFGYDPVFIMMDDPAGRTMAELGENEKNRLSHRARAAHALRPTLEHLSSQSA